MTDQPRTSECSNQILNADKGVYLLNDNDILYKLGYSKGEQTQVENILINFYLCHHEHGMTLHTYVQRGGGLAGYRSINSLPSQ